MKLFRQFWVIARPYWFSEERWAARGLLTIIIAINLGIVWVNVQLNTWNGEFYNSLQDKKLDLFQSLLLQFLGWALLYIILVVYQLYLTQMLQIRWRRWLTDHWLARWAEHKAYYRIAMFDRTTDNPDQRIADDLREFVNDALSLSIGLLSSVVSFLSFVGILWTLSGAMTVMGVNVPGYMVWVAIAYALIGSICAHLIGRPLIALNVEQQRFEADFRYSLIRIRDNAEAIALYRAEKVETATVKDRFTNVVDNFWQIMKRQKQFTWFASFYGQLAIIFPLVVGAPRYFSGAIQLGGLMQIANAFGEVQKALSWFVDAYVRLASWRSAIERLTGFSDAIERVVAAKSGFSTTQADSGLALAHLKMQTPDGGLLFQADHVGILPGQHTVVNGPSGSGKSTLFRALAGLWPYGSGAITTSLFSESLYLPQRPYLPLGSLRACIAYPAQSQQFSDDEIKAVLRLLHLEKFESQLDNVLLWHSILSPGEQQRIAIARALLNQPKWLYLDEATSALDEKTEVAIYKLLLDRLPNSTLVSIAHRSSLDQFHQQRLLVQPDSSSLLSERLI
jgi:vitamin B12/bleomycin/antimicrobial peptide transport system ATP-binding/permease protein